MRYVRDYAPDAGKQVITWDTLSKGFACPRCQGHEFLLLMLQGREQVCVTPTDEKLVKGYEAEYVGANSEVEEIDLIVDVTCEDCGLIVMARSAEAVAAAAAILELPEVPLEADHPIAVLPE